MTGAVGTAAAAILAEASARCGVDGWRRFLAVPSFVTPLELGDFALTPAAIAQRTALRGDDASRAAYANVAALSNLVDRVIEPDAVARAGAVPPAAPFLWEDRKSVV